MDEQLAKKMDKAMVGPRLYCQYCGEKKLLSPCYGCQYSKNNYFKYCRGCGDNGCEEGYEICRVFIKEKVLLEINKTLIANREYLDLSHSQLKELPVEIWQLTHLEKIMLEGNQLKELPAEIGKFAHLQRLWLSNNQISKLPAEIGKLTHLQKLGLSNNQLKELPIEIKQLSGLQWLIIRHNQLNKRQIQELKKALPNCNVVV